MCASLALLDCLSFGACMLATNGMLRAAVAHRRPSLTMAQSSNTYKSDDNQAPVENTSHEDVPSRVQHAASEVLKLYSTKSVEEQKTIIEKSYTEDAQFVDPLMVVTSPKEINLAFLSLIKLFKSVDVRQKSIYLNSKPNLPANLAAGHIQQFVVHNQQVYNLERKSAISRCILPDTVDLDVKTFLTFSQESGRLLRHEDIWLSNGFRFPSFLKPGNGVLSSWAFKMAGWGKEVDNAKFSSAFRSHEELGR